ncbi:MAG: undecaprenyl/decaprenyl-phosphate alpha-N-acetylglucosaminyl 1-phosphate transferase [candidate division Zixibacteria bacterium]|nr:undecaprenyl/decaprenyl-phosphate alpha-N-acetylglucosaminyl 1-phosphate transferase [candidate division Zixibacteria bacterium]
MSRWLAFLLSFGVSAALTPLVILLCRKKGIFDRPGPRKIHTRPTPRLGGISVFLGFWIALASVFLLNALPPIELVYVFWGSLAVFAVGLFDDLHTSDWRLKLLVQILGGAILVAGGLAIKVLYVPFVGAWNLGFWSLPVTLLWVVVITNSINLIDGLDGLAAGVSLIVALTLFLAGHFLQIPLLAVFSLCLAGALAGFFPFNYFPARIFMGDSGSLVVGFLFASLGLLFPIKGFAATALFIPLLTLGVPLVEAVSTIFRRLKSGQAWHQADQKHLFHRLLELGLSHTVTVWLFYSSSLAFSFLVLCLVTLDRRFILSGLVLLYLFLSVAFIILVRHVVERKK